MSFHIGKRALVAGGVVIALAALGLGLGLSMAGSGRHASSTTTVVAPEKHHPVQPCRKPGCAVVNKVQTAPEVVLYSGASCNGLNGPWFLNVVQGGPNNVPHLTYRMSWSFQGPTEAAQPNGTVIVSGAPGASPTVTLANGAEVVSGEAAGAPVNARGSLVVRLARGTSGTALVFSETGVAAAESELHITSPFGAGGSPLSLPVALSTSFKDC